MKMRSVLWMAVMLLLSCSAGIRASSVAKKNCPEKCGDVTVPYPFGFGKPECAKNDSFLLKCEQNGSLFFSNIQIYNISLENGTFTAGNIPSPYKCYDQSGLAAGSLYWSLNLTRWPPFTISSTYNKFIGLGCDTVAYMFVNEGQRFTSGCVALCYDPEAIKNYGACSGYGCCQTTIPENLKTLNITLTSFYNHSDIWKFNPCSYAFVVANSYDYSEINLQDYPTERPSTQAVIEWVFEGPNYCQESEPCGPNAICDNSPTGGGSRCHCPPGFIGNPYLQQGCQDIDECQDQNPCQEGACRNTIGNYTCDCPLGMRGDGKVGCRGLRLPITIAIGNQSYQNAPACLIHILMM
ncbi:hypothetical protein SLEP1_g17116 [Rubroshorea leprosula]|uniref:EGF-like domain-containing protein n=1 Tax=Rubroshorea leprosula TaxID=152421 RepID=A0AAV5J0U5_9ROSI|nr:hypothetical protein SLEP1_g17116 [Rubroshorea leprosula]